MLRRHFEISCLRKRIRYPSFVDVRFNGDHWPDWTSTEASAFYCLGIGHCHSPGVSFIECIQSTDLWRYGIR
jgi:hypothetical protein